VRGGRILGLGVLLLPLARGLADRPAGARLGGGGALSAAVAILVWIAAGWLEGRLLFGRALRRHLARGNGAAAVATAANQLALALMISRAVSGAATPELPVALVFVVIAIFTWGTFVGLFRMVTTYPDAQEIAGENHAAAVSYAGAAVALGVIIAHALDGPFLGWRASLHAYGAALMVALALYPVRQLVVEGLLLGCRPRWRGGELDRAVGQRHSVGVAAVEAAAYLATAWLVTSLT
jgi:uncharacterized membrane protein YjfL (UPF0719 family)